MVHCIFLGVSGYNLKKNCIFLLKDLSYLNKQCRPCSISSGSSLFVKVHVKGFPIYKGLDMELENIKVLNFCYINFWQEGA